MQSDVKKVTYGASVVALVGVLLWLNRYTSGMLMYYFSFIMPLPLILFAGKYGFKASLTPFIAIMIITLLFFIGSPATIFITVNSCLTGMVYGWGIHSKKNGNQLLLMTMFFTALSGFVTTYIFAEAFGINIQEEIDLILDVFKDAPMKMPLNLTIRDFVQAFYPIAVIFTAITEAFVVHMFSFVILKRLRYPLDNLKLLVTFKIPKWVGLLLVVLTFSSVLTSRFTDPRWASAVVVISTVSSLVLFIDGLIFVIWYLRKFGKGRDILYFYILLIFMVFALPISLLMWCLMFFGMIDMCSDFRNLLLKRSNNAG